MAYRSVRRGVIAGTTRPHLQLVQAPHVAPNRRRPGGPATLGADLDVLAGAECAGMKPDLFFSDDDGVNELAAAICGRCPVRAACLARALANGEQYGVFGGLTARQRRALNRPARKEAA